MHSLSEWEFYFPLVSLSGLDVRARRRGQYRFISRVMVCLDSQHVLRPNKNALSKRITFIFCLLLVDDMYFMLQMSGMHIL
jgi:hypothetical protein